SFIFRVPKLKSMLGANSLLGEFFAKELPSLMNDGVNLVKKLNTNRKDLMEKLNITQSDIDKHFDDTDKNSFKDDIIANFEKGIICSAGGHFEALFCYEKSARDFLEEALKKANETIPTVSLSHFLVEIKDDDKPDSLRSKPNLATNIKPETYQLIDSPYFYTSTVDGELPELGDNEDKESLISKTLNKQGVKFYNKNTFDFLSAFHKKHIKKVFHNKNSKNDLIQSFDLEDIKKSSLIPDNNKIAIIAVDGNGMGDRFKEYNKTLKDKSIFEYFIEVEKFWFEQRQNIRDMVKAGLDYLEIENEENKNEKDEKNKDIYEIFPLIIFMMGGDDLLVISAPELAFPFIEGMSNHLDKKNKSQQSQKNKDKKDDSFSFSAGVAFVKHSFPFVKGHELAESLLSSAKIKSKQNEKNESKKSSIDWHINFSSQIDDISDIREREYFLNYNDGDSEVFEVLTKRPYSISDLGAFMNKAKAIHDSYSKNKDKAGKNKYKALRTNLKQGKKYTEYFSEDLIYEKKDSEKTSEKTDDLCKFSYEKISDLTYEKYDSKNGERSLKTVYINDALDYIEYLDFFERKNR
ncbi:hypothetical protein JXR93_09570, partial [bacterium]|nr:hypothetical protein [bacterium]